MKFSILTSLIATAGLLASAAPLRIVVISETHGSAPTNIRVGFPAAPNHTWDGPLPMVKYVPPPPPGRQSGCGGARAKAIRVRNAFRKALGMPLIEPEPIHLMPHVDPEHHHRRPERDHRHTPEHEHHHGHHHHHNQKHDGHFRHSRTGESFSERLYFALSALGVWEGRAVAFVLGCGLGALLRMISVMAILSYRSFRGASEEEAEYHHVLFEQVDAEELIVAPPNYSIDEKAPLEDELAEAK